MASFNKVLLIGNLTKDPDYKQIGIGSVCRLSIAINRQFKNKQGAMVQEVCFVDIDVWGPQAENCRQYLQKGRSVLVEGRLKFDTWKDAEGQMKSRHSVTADRVVFLGTGNTTSESATSEEHGIGDEQFSSIENKKNVVKGKTESQKDRSDSLASSVMFEDQSPFIDDLPF